ncbi:MAG: extensin family protein [Hyphomicrobium sp.]
MRRLARAFIAMCLLALALVGIWLGLLPQRFSPFAPLNLAEPASWFIDARLAALRRDSALCRAVLVAPLTHATAVTDNPYKNGCGWKNAVSLRDAGGARIGGDTITCEMAAALTLWIAHSVQPAAERHLGKRVTSISDFGTYACRNIVGSKMLSSFRSQHASANAIDISAFTLDGGHVVSVLKHWPTDTPEARFLAEIHSGACRYFRVALGPNFNKVHANHFHFDRGFFTRCK